MHALTRWPNRPIVEPDEEQRVAVEGFHGLADQIDPFLRVVWNFEPGFGIGSLGQTPVVQGDTMCLAPGHRFLSRDYLHADSYRRSAYLRTVSVPRIAPS